MYRLLACQRLGATQNLRLPFAQLRSPNTYTNNENCSTVPKAGFSHLLRNPTTPTTATTTIGNGIKNTPAEGPSQRHLSTTTTKPETIAKKKRTRKCHYGKYVDLLEVTEAAANERKSRVKRLNAKKLEDFIYKSKLSSKTRTSLATTSALKSNSLPQPIEYQKIDLDALDPTMLHSGIFDDKPLIFFGKEKISESVISDPNGVENILKSFNNFRDIIESIESEQHDTDAIGSTAYSALESRLCDQDSLSPLDTVEPYLQPNDIVENKNRNGNLEAKATTKSKPRFKSKKHNNEELERLAKERAMRINLNSFLSVCVSSGALNRALSTVVAYRQRSKKSKTSSAKSLITIELYNILLNGYAAKGAFDRFKHIFTLLEEDAVSFNEQTFAAIFECLGRLQTTEDNVATIKSYIQKAEEMGYTLHQIMDKSKFILDQRDTVLNAIRRVHPDFLPIYTPPVLGYDNVLLNHLNKDILPIGTDSEVQTKHYAGKTMHSKLGYNKEQLEEMSRQQLKVEVDGCITIKSIEKSSEYNNTQYCREKLKDIEALWRSQISAAIIRDLNTLKAQVRFKPSGYMNYYTYLKALDASQFADILIQEIYKLAEGSETFSPTVGQLYRELGQKVQQRYHIEQKKSNGILEKMGEIYSSYCTQWETSETSDNTRQIWQRLVHEARSSGSSMDMQTISWPTNVLTGVGRFLYNILMRDIKIDAQIMRQKGKSKQQNMLPAFYTIFRNQGRLMKEEVKPHPVLARLLRASRKQTLTFDSNLVPMLCPPQPWSTAFNGGYLLNKTELIRLPHQAIQQWERINAASLQSIYPALDSLNQLASIPWRVNTDILDIIIEVFQNGGDAKLDVPQPPNSLPPLPTIHKSDTSVSNEERAQLFKNKLIHRRRQAEMYSLWCDTLYRLSLANHYRNKVFWLPHNMDFRGRVYPVPPHLNHLGSDLARSMLVFDQAQPLGPDGFSWLKLHCINLTGLKKRDSVRERLLYAEDVMSEILDSADNPLTGRMWWAKSEEPWQTLACCIEIAKVYRSDDIEGYMSRFPIHQDGSCNGLQHYAALGRDKAGAYSVNLAPSEIPQDVYSSVATLVEKARKNDAANGLHVAQALEGYVRRKVIKQTVMTTVYGVTRYGARLQIARQLKDIEDFPKEWVWPASTYLTTKTFESLREMFTSTREIQDWFTDCARLISSVCSKNVEWVTPLGLPVVQPYNRQELKSSGCPRTGSRIPQTLSTDLYERPNVMKQKNAFPPNFIHSLDSSHMMLTSLHCEREGLTFVSVHDCFWTHACTVPDLNKICREQFVALHSQPILEDLSRSLQERFSFDKIDLTNDGSTENLSQRQLNRVLRQMPQKGDFDLMKVLESVYFFS